MPYRSCNGIPTINLMMMICFFRVKRHIIAGWQRPALRLTPRYMSTDSNSPFMPGAHLHVISVCPSGRVMLLPVMVVFWWETGIGRTANDLNTCCAEFILINIKNDGVSQIMGNVETTKYDVKYMMHIHVNATRLKLYTCPIVQYTAR